jgi:hypothetical protein
VFVGDGASDRYAAHHADVVFAKDALARYCEAADVPYVAWRRLGDVASWVRDALADERLPSSPTGFATWAADRRSAAERFICGPEAPASGRLGLVGIGSDAPDVERLRTDLPGH